MIQTRVFVSRDSDEAPVKPQGARKPPHRALTASST